MRQEWIDDILAIIEYGSLQKASEQRFLTQPAFSRRINVIETYLRTPILDRSTKPATVLPGIAAYRDRMQELSLALKNLTNELRHNHPEVSQPVVLVSQHSITASYSSNLLDRLNPSADEQITLRSENWDACYTLLMTREADIAVTYGVDAIPPLLDGDLIEQHQIGVDQFIPVFGTDHVRQLNQLFARGQLPIIGYPNDVFMGSIMRRDILPRIGSLDYVRQKTQTALTIAALHLAAAGVGVAWVPLKLAERSIAEGVLTDMRDSLPSATLHLTALRMKGPATERKEAVWQALITHNLN